MKLVDYLPDVWDNSAEVLAIQSAIEPEVVKLWAARDGLLAQLNVTTATWGLGAWERALGLEVAGTVLPEIRRERIYAKLRGQGTTTVAMIRNVSSSFYGGEVDVLEHPETYSIDIKFSKTIGRPANMDYLIAALGEIMPAHLAYDFIIIFRAWGELAGYTWGALTDKTWGNIKEGTI